MSLNGSTRARSRDELFKNARETAAAYYGHKCVHIHLTNEAAHTDHSFTETRGAYFTADFTATEKHRPNGKPFGFPECTGCGKELQ